MLCIPCGFFVSFDTRRGGRGRGSGSNLQCTLPFGTSDEQGAEQPLEMEVAVLLVDFGIEVLTLLRDLGEDIVSDVIFPYSLHQPEACPLTEDLAA